MVNQPFDVPSDSNMFDLTDRVAAFMHARFLKYLASDPPEQGPVPPLDFDIHLLTDIELLARRAAWAYEHRSTLLSSMMRLPICHSHAQS